jgi:hypothetical protein
LAQYLQSELFNAIMCKYPTWTEWSHLYLKRMLVNVGLPDKTHCTVYYTVLFLCPNSFK